MNLWSRPSGYRGCDFRYDQQEWPCLLSCYIHPNEISCGKISQDKWGNPTQGCQRVLAHGNRLQAVAEFRLIHQIERAFTSKPMPDSQLNQLWQQTISWSILKRINRKLFGSHFWSNKTWRWIYFDSSYDKPFDFFWAIHERTWASQSRRKPWVYNEKTFFFVWILWLWMLRCILSETKFANPKAYKYAWEHKTKQVQRTRETMSDTKLAIESFHLFTWILIVKISLRSFL